MTEEEQEKLRLRIHRLADQVQAHGITLAEHRVLINGLGTRFDGLVKAMATGEQLDNAVERLELKLTGAKQQLEGAVSLIEQKVTHVHEDLKPIQRGIYWVVTLIIGAVILAVLALVIKGGVRP